MTFKTYEINVDLVHDTSTTCSNRFSQNDRNSAKLLVTITNKGAELDLSQAKSVRMSFKKPDGTRVFQNDCQPINAMKGKYQIVLKTQTLTSVSNVIAQIHIEEEDRIIDTQKFFFVVNDSLASDEAIESTNEFTIIQKAIEAGKKLEGVDINGIIAAGVKADEALPKAGGTMTGNVDMDISVGAKSKGYRWRDKDGALFGLETSTTGELILYDYKAAARVWQYDPVAKRLSVLSDTNLLKTTGGTMTGNINMDTTANSKMITGYRNGKATSALYFVNDNISIEDRIRNKSVWQYDSPSETFTLYTPNTNLLKKTGDTMTGDFKMTRPNATTARTIRWDTNGVEDVVLGLGGSAKWVAWDQKNAKGIYEYDPGANTFTITAANVKTAKDGRADLVLTADATNFDTSRPPVAVRRGNTVTIRGAIGVSASATANLVTTLPTDMRPIDSLTQTILTNDGSATTLEVYPDGRVILSNSAKGKNIYIVFTYVVN
ncbi:BppU family phage baseplate upper protein [Bacillus cereus group sp. TH43LC]|uniref:BppU family phage baseplate upper protein n=1 Tax=Bacillus cereus group sp. TH43LC TaxID=3018037 RepID=UPI0022E72491|nr:BppU family phage baseplate upper protein [Bacillus cereus group sp. TH43LC]MDA1504852.1 BppU family phage baseplate upper protein [Bacillus cereus group sp. TH43LC]